MIRDTIAHVVPGLGISMISYKWKFEPTLARAIKPQRLLEGHVASLICSI